MPPCQVPALIAAGNGSAKAFARAHRARRIPDRSRRSGHPPTRPHRHIQGLALPAPGRALAPHSWWFPVRARRASPWVCHALHLRSGPSLSRHRPCASRTSGSHLGLVRLGAERRPAGRQPGFVPRLAARDRPTRLGAGASAKRSLNGRAPGPPERRPLYRCETVALAAPRQRSRWSRRRPHTRPLYWSCLVRLWGWHGWRNSLL